MGSTNGADNFDIAQVWGTPRLRINSSGYVGIGVASPASRLSILQGAADGAGTSAMGIGFQYDSTFTRAGIYADGITGWLGALHFATNPGANSHTLTPRMTIRDDKVGIGTIIPQTALHVIGTLTVSSGIVVAGSTMTVPDYVFDESYKLMPLDELKEYIEINKHLPAFKSDIKDLNLVADNMALRKTIEELTLYILQMKNEINLLKLRY